MLKYDIRKDFCTKGNRIRGKSSKRKRSIRAKTKESKQKLSGVLNSYGTSLGALNTMSKQAMAVAALGQANAMKQAAIMEDQFQRQAAMGNGVIVNLAFGQAIQSPGLVGGVFGSIMN